MSSPEKNSKESAARPTVLIAEDELIIRRTVEVALDIAGFSVIATEDGQQCLDTLKSGLHPDLLLLDLGMPVLDGIQTIQILREDKRYDDLPIVILSGRNESSTVKQAIQAGAWDYILKPFDLKGLARRVADLIFRPTQATLRGLIASLHFQDPSILQNPGLKSAGKGKDAYPTLAEETSLCVLVPEGVAPQTLVSLSDEELRSKVSIFRKCSYGWRKIWPRQF